MASRPLPTLGRVLLGHELALLFLVVCTGLIAGLSAYFWHATSVDSIRINRLVYESLQIRSDLYRQIKEVTWARLLEDPQALVAYARSSREIDRHFNVLRQRSASRAEDEAIQDMQRAYRTLQIDMNKIFADPYLSSTLAPIRILDPDYEQGLIGGFEESFARFRDLLAREGRELERREEAWTRVALVVIPIPVLLAVLLLGLTRRSLQRGFVRPVGQLMAGARRISDGRLGEPIPTEGVRELAALAAAVNDMAVELGRSRERLRESERQAAHGALVPVVAHNIRNPLASIRATAQLIDEHATPQEQREIREAIIETVDRLGRWVSALVSYLHPLRPQPVPRSPTRLLEAVLALLAPRLAERAVRVVFEAWDADTEVAVDADLMEQALYGLVSNAVDASPEGGILALSAQVEGEHYVLRISDEGQGMPFQPESHGLVPGPTTKRMGTGLGIPIAFKVCRAHGWELGFAGRAGGGTCVTVRAPLAGSGLGREEQAEPAVATTEEDGA